MKRVFFIVSLLLTSSTVWAGGLLTNTNQSAHFLRNLARDASTEIDAAYTNPAGTSMLDEGFHFSINNQSAFQTRLITTDFAPFAANGGNSVKEFEGTASAPIIPSIQAVYRSGNWAFSANIAVSGGGGKATFNDGLPSFESGLAMLPGIINAVGKNPAIPGGITADRYEADSYMRGSSFIYGVQMGGAYKINQMFAAYAGFRMNIVNNGYEGYLQNLKSNPISPALGYTGVMTSADKIIDMAISGTTNEAQLASLGLLKKASLDGVHLDVSQTGWGVSPILGFNFNHKKLNVGMKYEFRTTLNVENKTKVDDTHGFKDGVNTPHDIPALLTIGAAYDILPKLKASIGFHQFFDSSAKMDKDKQKHISGGTHEFLAGLEYKISNQFLISGGYQSTRQGVNDAYQSDLSFALNSYSVGFGGAVNITEKVRINIAYMFTNYTDWTVTGTSSNLPLKNTFGRTNKVFGVGVDFRIN